VLDHAGGEFVEGAGLLDGDFHAAGDGFEELMIVDLPGEPGADFTRKGAAAGTGFSADGQVEEAGDGGTSRYGRHRSRGPGQPARKRAGPPPARRARACQVLTRQLAEPTADRSHVARLRRVSVSARAARFFSLVATIL